MVVVTVKFLGDDRILSSEDIEKVGGLTTLGLIPLQEEGSQAHRGFRYGRYTGKKE